MCGRSMAEDLAIVAMVNVTGAELDPGVTLGGEKLQVDCDGKPVQEKETDAANGPKRGAVAIV